MHETVKVSSLHIWSARAWSESKNGARCLGAWDGGRLDPKNLVISRKNLVISRKKGRGLTKVGVRMCAGLENDVYW